MATSLSTGFCSRILGAQSFDQIFDGGCIELRSGAQPASADDAATGLLLARITTNGDPWAAGDPTNGLRYSRSGRFVVRRYEDTWRLTGLASGTAGWFRVLPQAADAGAVSTVAPRIDGAVVALPGGGFPSGDFQMALPIIELTASSSVELVQWIFQFPM